MKDWIRKRYGVRIWKWVWSGQAPGSREHVAYESTKAVTGSSYEWKIK
jgi:hypothetical protein